MQRKFVYFINPISGTKNKDELLALIKRRTDKKNIPFEILHTNAEGRYDYLLEKIATEKITDVIVCGGDGTVNQIAATLQGTAVNIGIVPMGSGNGLALAAGIKRSPDKALDIIFKGNAAPIDSFYINGNFSCMLCGLGFDAQVAHDFAKQKKRGLITYIKQTIKNFIHAKTYNFILQINDMTVTTEAFFISIANSNQFGNNVTIAPKASISDGLLDIVVVSKMSKMKLLYAIAKQVTAGQVDGAHQKKYSAKDIYYYQARAVTIQNPEQAPLHIDGDPANTAESFEIKIIEKAFNLLQP
ncbi:diacylglycerol kinase family protein [Ferruginibacter sp. HRS2-29]|uniref:diacylglycerol/lipid kinase family protein n=1 Tax=Ferruginibacter sp. HRS2-29 TaxID=2487334 RepID=UPI0020CD4C6D|nr:YegS/Rv2252/BmrU family lipid kinase [Ferruginibacter sp. HRS2-29]MCP9753021.1 YegS/Rv2252/BmrU family lipid kinase [Ferruginibacter sp. HRS2-29]